MGVTVVPPPPQTDILDWMLRMAALKSQSEYSRIRREQLVLAREKFAAGAEARDLAIEQARQDMALKQQAAGLAERKFGLAEREFAAGAEVRELLPEQIRQGMLAKSRALDVSEGQLSLAQEQFAAEAPMREAKLAQTEAATELATDEHAMKKIDFASEQSMRRVADHEARIRLRLIKKLDDLKAKKSTTKQYGDKKDVQAVSEQISTLERWLDRDLTPIEGVIFADEIAKVTSAKNRALNDTVNSLSEMMKLLQLQNAMEKRELGSMYEAAGELHNPETAHLFPEVSAAIRGGKLDEAQRLMQEMQGIINNQSDKERKASQMPFKLSDSQRSNGDPESIRQYDDAVLNWPRTGKPAPELRTILRPWRMRSMFKRDKFITLTEERAKELELRKEWQEAGGGVPSVKEGVKAGAKDQPTRRVTLESIAKQYGMSSSDLSPELAKIVVDNFDRDEELVEFIFRSVKAGHSDQAIRQAVRVGMQ